MKVCVQWSTDPASGWVDVDSSDWASLPKKADPGERVPVCDESGCVVGFDGDSVVIDDQPGWITALSVCGTKMSKMDAYAVEHDAVESCIRVYCIGGGSWDVDYAKVYTFWCEDEDVSWSETVDGMTFTHRSVGKKMRCDTYASDYESYPARKDREGSTIYVLPFSDFTAPDEPLVRYGVYMPHALYEDHRAISPPLKSHWDGEVF